MGVIVFVRNTRRVALTEAGGVLYACLLAATAQIDDAFTALTRFRDRPAGTLPRALGALVLKGLAPRFRRAWPDVALDISLDDGEVDLLEQDLAARTQSQPRLRAVIDMATAARVLESGRRQGGVRAGPGAGRC